MTLDEVIAYEEEAVKMNEKDANELFYASSHIEQRQACMEAANRHWQLVEWLKDYKRLLAQESKTGYWIMTNDYYTGAYGSIDYVKCSCCQEDSLEEGNYCPNCGAIMVEPPKNEE